MSEPGAVGNRLKKLRTERSLSQAELAERAGVSQDLVAKLEQGTRQSARLTSLIKLADALDVELSELIDKHSRIERTDDSGTFLAVRNVLLSPSYLPGIDRRDDGGEATPLPDLEAAVSAGWGDYWTGRFGHLAATLPGMIAEARITAAAPGGAAASTPLAQSYQLAACLLVHMGKTDLAAIGAERALEIASQGSDVLQGATDLAAIGAERALQAAAGGNDELLWATLHGTYSWILYSQGRLYEAEQHALRIAERVEPSFTKSRPQQLTVWGGLMLTAMAPAAVGGHRTEALEYISLARAAAARLDADRHDYWISFGPTQVAMQATYANAVLGHPTQALRAARDVRRQDLFTVSYCRHLLDVGQAQVEARFYDSATSTLEQARALAPEWFRHQGVAHAVVAELIGQRRRLTPALRRLARGVGVN
jgi:transcriptional regulator with XRE-family HTH domain